MFIIHGMNMHRTDLNLLYVFDAVMAERNVTRASHRLAMTQPAVSNAIRRLRYVFQDELFVRTSSGVDPTLKAQSLWPEIQESLKRLMALVNTSDFDASQTSETFRIAITDSLTPDLIPDLSIAFSKAAPKARLHFHHHTNVTSAAELERGGLDCAIGMFPRPATSLKVDALFTDEYICAMRRGHPLSHTLLTIDSFAAADHVLMKPSGVGQGVIDHWLDACQRSRNVVIVVNHFAEALAIIRNTDLITAMPRGFASKVLGKDNDVILVPLPFEIEKILYKLAWHNRSDQNPAQIWFRKFVRQVLGVA